MEERREKWGCRDKRGLTSRGGKKRKECREWRERDRERAREWEDGRGKLVREGVEERGTREAKES